MQREKTMQHGVLICVEGIDGSGKTTQARRLVKALKRLGYDAVYTTEPSKGVYGKIIRKHILQGDSRVPTVVEAVLFAADRVQHVENQIEPFLKAGKIVVCDRYVYSSIAYQGASCLDMEWIKDINKHAVKPHLTIYLDVAPEIVINRIQRKKSVMETLQTLKKVRRLYLQLVDKKQLVKVNGDAPINEVAKNIQDTVSKFLEKR
ncbi:MAG: dTMP kinase [Candidatus Bathyarchaeia archaeon]